jgi:hypothetical protein
LFLRERTGRRRRRRAVGPNGGTRGSSRLTGRQPLILYGSHVDFEQTNVIPDKISEGTGGVTEPIRRRIVTTRTTSSVTRSFTPFNST